jgi:hypothetical protein
MPCARCGPVSQTRVLLHDEALSRRFQGEHEAIRADIDQLRIVADALGFVSTAQALAEVKNAYQLLVEEIEPHERAEEEELYPALDRLLGGSDHEQGDIPRSPIRSGGSASSSPTSAPGRQTTWTSLTCAACSTGCTPSSGCTPRRKTKATSPSATASRQPGRPPADSGHPAGHIRWRDMIDFFGVTASGPSFFVSALRAAHHPQ